MDRNTVIATVLITLVMLAWMYLAAPPPQAQQETASPDSLTAVDTVAREQQAPPEPAPQQQAGPRIGSSADPLRPSSDSLLAGATSGEEQLLTIDTELFRARFSTKGGTPVSFELKKYTKFDQQTPVDLIRPETGGAVGLVFTTPNNHVVDTRSLYFDASVSAPNVQGDSLVTLAEGDTARIAFTAQLGGGSLTQTYTIVGDEYELDYAVDQTRPDAYSTRSGYEVVWNGGLPYTENDAETEATASGAYARSGGELESILLQEDDVQDRTLRGQVDWVAAKSKYFTAVIIPDQETRGAELVGAKQEFTEEYSASLLMPAATDAPDTFRLYLGPMDFYRITDYNLGLYDMVDYGIDLLEIITRPLATWIFIPAFTFLGSFMPNYGLVIILFAIILKMILYPLTKSSYTSMARMRELQPKMEAIREKYADDPQQQQQAMMKMYQETGVNPLGGCLPMLLQYPVIIALWQYLPNSIQIRQESFLWAHDLSAPDVILSLPFEIPFYGDYVAGFTLLMGLSMIVQMRLQSGASGTQAKVLMYVMPAVIFVIFNRFASGLSLYYLTYNIMTAIQQKYINTKLENEEEQPKKSAKGRKSKRKKVRS